MQDRLRILPRVVCAVGLLVIATLTSRRLPAQPVAPSPPPAALVSTHGNETPADPSHVLVVMNAASADSRAIADRYMAARHIPEANLLRIVCPETDEWPLADYQAGLERPIRQRTLADSKIDYVVLTRGIPFRCADSGSDGGYSIDSLLSVCDLNPKPAPKSANPYFRSHKKFSRAEFGILLVTRLDGLTIKDALALIESSVRAQARRGPFYLRDSFIESMASANTLLQARGFETEYVPGANNSAYPEYEGRGGPYMAHWGAGPHDTQFSEERFARLHFLPGAICDITWSASAAALHNPQSPGNIAVMTANGAAGAQGYVSEPYSDALSIADIVLERYTRGANIAEAFSAGTPYVYWKQLVLGDPLCAAYAGP
jgi:uncharacterized protein (TIGR03790 family)